MSNNTWLLVADYVREQRIQNKSWIQIFTDVMNRVQIIFTEIELEEDK